MKCPFCGDAENKVIDSRISKDGKAIRRRRECMGCSRRFTTYEYVEDILPMVVKKDGRRGYLQVGPCIEEIHRCPGAPSPASDKPCFYQLAVGSLRQKGRQLNLFLLRFPGTG